MLSGGEGAEIIQHTHCCDSSELPDFYTSTFRYFPLSFHFDSFEMPYVAEFCQDFDRRVTHSNNSVRFQELFWRKEFR